MPRAFLRKRTPAYRVLREDPSLRLLVLDQCVPVMQAFFAPATRRSQEGIVYLYGKTDGTKTLAIGVFRPQAHTTAGSFEVSPRAMAHVVQTVCDFGLQVVGQVHSHPAVASHSQGDEEGARIAHDGFVSIVLPNYAKNLPSLTGTASYMYRRGRFVRLDRAAVSIIPGRME